MNKLITHEFITQVKVVRPLFETKGWHINHTPYFIGLTGYQRKKKIHKILLPRPQCIISLGSFVNTPTDECPKELKWEVKTHWTTKRNLFTDFEPAWRLFLEIEQQYNPKNIKWAKLNSDIYCKKY